MLESLNPTVIGYSLNVVGLFFLASAISFKKPRGVIEENLGLEPPRTFSNVRDHLVNQIQTYIGFLFLVTGHVLLMGDALLRQDALQEGEARAVRDNTDIVVIVGVLVVSTIATMAVLKIVQLLFTRRNVRRLVADVLRDSNYDLTKNQKVAVQIGEMLGLPTKGDLSITEYIQEIHRALGLADPRVESRSRTGQRPVDNR